MMDLKARAGVTTALTQTLGDALVEEIRKRTPGVQVLSSEDLRSLLGLIRTKQMLGCTNEEDASCLAEIGGGLGASRLVVGSLGKLGETFLLNVRLFDVRQGKVLGSASERLVGQTEESLLAAVSHVTAKLFPTATELQAELAGELLTPAAMAAPEPRSHLLGLALGGLAVASLIVAGIGVGEVVDFNSWRAGLGPGGVSTSGAQTRVNQANTWATVAIPLGLVALGAGTGAVLAW